MTEKRSRRGPFRPGPGGLPPFLAGRQAEQDLFSDLVEDLAAGIPPLREVVLHGPRGNGKTALLRWLRDRTAAFPAVDAVHLTPSMCRTTGDLAERLLPESRWKKRSSPADPSADGVAWKPGEGRHPAVDEVLRARASRRPVVLMFDEAHTLDPEVGQALLNASQVVGRDLPFLLVLAGTPGLKAHLRTMSASFWSRSRSVAIGRLPDEAAAEAIRRPLANDGIAITDEALALILAESHGYPYFLQLWGEAVWRRAAATSPEGKRVTTAVVDAARDDFRAEQGIYYRERYDELKKADRLPAARAVADAFEGRELLADADLEAALWRGLGEESAREEVREVEELLYDLGYIWRPGPRPRWEPGIPSLMDYIRQNTPPLS